MMRMATVRFTYCCFYLGILSDVRRISDRWSLGLLDRVLLNSDTLPRLPSSQASPKTVRSCFHAHFRAVP